MKKVLAIATFALFTSTFGFATVKGEEPKINFEKVNDLSFKVNFENAKGQKATIKLTDENGKMIYQETTTADKTVALNLVNPVEGEYRIVVELNGEKLSYDFEIEKI